MLALQGSVEFATAELALLAVRTHVDDEVVPRGVVIDLDHVTSCEPVARLLLDAIIDEAVRYGLGVATVDGRGRSLLRAPAEFPPGPLRWPTSGRLSQGAHGRLRPAGGPSRTS